MIPKAKPTFRLRRTHRNVNGPARIKRTNDFSFLDREFSTVRETARVKDTVVFEKVALFSSAHGAMLLRTLKSTSTPGFDISFAIICGETRSPVPARSARKDQEGRSKT
ncbi:MAG: hypothetical protein AAB250_14695, partial [Bdellovibrionota bacterium]